MCFGWREVQVQYRRLKGYLIINCNIRRMIFEYIATGRNYYTHSNMLNIFSKLLEETYDR